MACNLVIHVKCWLLSLVFTSDASASIRTSENSSDISISISRNNKKNESTYLLSLAFTTDASTSANTRKGNILILVLVLVLALVIMLASRSFSRWNKSCYACAYAYACARVTSENQALMSTVKGNYWSFENSFVTMKRLTKQSTPDTSSMEYNTEKKLSGDTTKAVERHILCVSHALERSKI